MTRHKWLPRENHEAVDHDGDIQTWSTATCEKCGFTMGVDGFSSDETFDLGRIEIFTGETLFPHCDEYSNEIAREVHDSLWLNIFGQNVQTLSLLLRVVLSVGCVGPK